MEQKTSQVKMHMNGRTALARGPIQLSSGQKLSLSHFDNLGVGGFHAMDAALTGPAVKSGYIDGHMLETWLPGTIRVITQIRNIDEIVGISTIGKWTDEQIKVRVSEPAAKAELYGDFSNIPLADYTQTVESRGIVRFEQGFQVGKLEDARQNIIDFNAAEEKRKSVAESLDTARNEVGFRGFNSPNANIYGLLNDPSLPAWLTADVPWEDATFEELTEEFTTLVSALEGQMGGSFRDSDRMVMVLPTGYRKIMHRFSATLSSMSFGTWLRENYPNIRFVYTPDFVGANGGLDAVYLFIESAVDADESTITSASVIQAVPVRFQVLGSETRIKGYIEDAINATAGIFVLRPWAFARMTISA